MKERVCLDGCEVTTATIVCCVVSFGCKMASLLPGWGGNSSWLARGMFSISMSQSASGLSLRSLSVSMFVFFLISWHRRRKIVTFDFRGPNAARNMDFRNTFTPWIRFLLTYYNWRAGAIQPYVFNVRPPQMRMRHHVILNTRKTGIIWCAHSTMIN